MFYNNLVWGLLLMLGLASGTIGLGLGNPSERLERMQNMLSSDPSSASLVANDEDHLIRKRVILDQSCKGIYDRKLFSKLNRVCDDCYNLYRKAHVGVDCRSNCYNNRVFRQCLDDLMMEDVIDQYIMKVQMVGK